MVRRAIAIAAFVAAGAMAGVVAPACADPVFVSFGFPGARLIDPSAINSAGDVTGSWIDADFGHHGFVRFADGTLQSFDAAGPHAETKPRAINDKGEIAGTIDAGDVTHGFLRAPDGKVTPIRMPGMEQQTYVTGLNNAGITTGYAFTPDAETFRGFVRKPHGRKEVFEVAGADELYDFAINDAGTVATAYPDGARKFHFLVRTARGAITMFDVDPDVFSAVEAINAAGTLAGTAGDTGFTRTPDGTVKRFSLYRRSHVHVTGMNAAGTVAGWVVDRKQRTHGFLRFANGTDTTFEYPGIRSGTYVDAINDSGVVAGSYYGADGPAAFLRFP